MSIGVIMQRKVYAISALFLFFLVSFSYGQNLLNQPESVVYDQVNDRYILSNWGGNGHLIQVDSEGNQDYYMENVHCHAGLYLQDGILYVACRDYGVKGIDLATDSILFSVPGPGISNLNDIVADTSGNLYLSYPTENKIYRFNLEDRQLIEYVTEGLTTPNGMHFDAENNRIVLISYRLNSPVQAIDLADSSLSTIRQTPLDGLDGLVRDSNGYWYVSSWYTNALHRFEPDFSGVPQIVATFNDDPADIHFDSCNNLIAVPLFFTHGLAFVDLEDAVRDFSTSELPAEMIILSNYPNPFNSTTTLRYYLPETTDVRLQIYNLLGQPVYSYSVGLATTGWHSHHLHAYGFSSGVYIVAIDAMGIRSTSRIHLVK